VAQRRRRLQLRRQQHRLLRHVSNTPAAAQPGGSQACRSGVACSAAQLHVMHVAQRLACRSVGATGHTHSSIHKHIEAHNTMPAGHAGPQMPVHSMQLT
jgi:hypothetical protein